MRGRGGRGGKLTARDRLWFAVVERTGCRSVAEAKAVVTEREFRRWCEYIPREPSVGDRLDAWFPQLIAGVVNNIPFRGRSPALRVADLTPDRWGERPAGPAAPTRLRGADLGAMLKAWAGG